MASRSDLFWMVYGLGQSQPTVRHKTEHTARVEAERLARANPGIRFYVLEAITVSVKTDVETTSLRDELPF